MVGSKDLPASTTSFAKVFYNNQFCEKPVWPAEGTSLQGKTAIITGANQGLGYEAAKQLVNLGLSNLIIAVRSVVKGEAAATKLRDGSSTMMTQIDVWQLDMSSYSSVQAFARRVDSELPRVDYALLNAGVMSLQRRTVETTGHEEIVQVNYLSTMLLLIILLPVLKRKQQKIRSPEPPHISITSAALTLIGKVPNKKADPFFASFDDPKQFNAQEHYNSSKLMAQMFLWKLVEYVKADDVVVNLTDPAWVRGTSLTRDVTGPMKLFMKGFEMTGRTPEVGASCLVNGLIGQGKESHGCFLMSWKIHPFASLLYSPDGQSLTEKVWKETLAELSFADVKVILESMRK